MKRFAVVKSLSMQIFSSAKADMLYPRFFGLLVCEFVDIFCEEKKQSIRLYIQLFSPSGSKK